MKVCGIIMAAGSGTRMHVPRNKVFFKFEGRSALIRCVCTHVQTGLFDSLIVVCREEERGIVADKLKRHAAGIPCRIVSGGKERQDSVRNALRAVAEDTDIVSVHDAARCFVTPELIRACVDSAIRHGSGVAMLQATDTVKEVHNGCVTATLDRRRIMLAQTPQVFSFDLLKRAYDAAYSRHYYGTDEAGLVERIGEPVYAVAGEKSNIKLTTKEDLAVAKGILNNSGWTEMRMGSGMDVHAFADHRKLILGGVEIPGGPGLLGHSDADVLTHAVMDALLGAAHLGDIGEHFPPTDEQYRGISSLLLLKKVGQMLARHGCFVVNIDATVVAQAPKISPYKKQMEQNIAYELGIAPGCVSVKATTTEHLGFTGRKEGIAAMAVCMLRQRG